MGSVTRLNGGQVAKQNGRYVATDYRKSRSFATVDEAFDWVSERVRQYGAKERPAAGKKGEPYRGPLEFNL